MARDARDYNVELSSSAAGSAEGEGSRPAGRPFISVHFACCGAYQRIYRNPEQTAYDARCPRCGRAVRFAVGREGTTARMFVVR